MFRDDFRRDFWFGCHGKGTLAKRLDFTIPLTLQNPLRRALSAIYILGVELSTIANVATALTVLTGVAFGLIEMRRARRDREERAAFAAVQALMTPEWMSSSMIVASIRDGASGTEIENDPRILEAALKIATIMEGIGYSVFARIVPLSVADDLVGGMARVAWRKFRPFVEEERVRTGTQKSWEWFQWLAEQLERHSPGKTSLKAGAAVVYRDWKP